MPNLHPLPDTSGLREWKIHFYQEIAAASGQGDQGLTWIRATEKAEKIEDLAHVSPSFEQFDLKLSQALNGLLPRFNIQGEHQGHKMMRQIAMKIETYQSEDRMIRSRQIYFLILSAYVLPGHELTLVAFDLSLIHISEPTRR